MGIRKFDGASQVSKRRALLGDVRMSRVDELTTAEIDERIISIIEPAGEELMRFSDPSFEFVPERMRGGISAIHERLRAELAELLKLRTVYGDLIVCRIVASNYPWTHDQLSPYQHLRVAWLQLTQLSSMFDRSMTELDRLHDETLELLSIDVEGVFADASPRTRAVEQNARADRWFEVVPHHEVQTFERMRIASQLPIADALVFEYCDAARRELLEQIDATTKVVSSGIAVFLSRHGAELLDLIGRYNGMIENFRLQHSRK
ncbi:hypothetical protein M2189_008722 [Bradyrhizobium japonicum]|uniref:hypothetical protein n=1 Tax=Bradyrhizobium japonicum TaxID=375 RepID=UPI002166D6A9|nr:hypothetical protein [Bradyrhizobium japonicum]MCS3501767.1 hypothetical protein [Bradyrhizobium japonicum]MCS3965519.1 hypothetical protein [Bradyrhizobium japonicum]MCS3997826.1 hypothetical protein [Bradyrhizobium japonicum]